MSNAITKMADLRPPRPHLHADDLHGETEVTVEGYLKGEVGTNKDVRGKIKFREFEQPMIVNVSKYEAITKVYEDLDELLGAKVIVFPTTAQMNGKTVPAIGLKIPKRK